MYPTLYLLKGDYMLFEASGLPGCRAVMGFRLHRVQDHFFVGLRTQAYRCLRGSGQESIPAEIHIP